MANASIIKYTEKFSVTKDLFNSKLLINKIIKNIVFLTMLIIRKDFNYTIKIKITFWDSKYSKP